MRQDLVKTVLMIEGVENGDSESKGKMMLLIRRTTKEGDVYERLDFIHDVGNNNCVGHVSNKVITADQYILLLEKYFTSEDNTAYYCIQKKQKKK